MKFLKTFRLNNKEVKDKSIVYRADQQIIMDSVVSLRVPTGTGDPKFAPGTDQNQRPSIPYRDSGLLRYNLSLDALEVLQSGIWYQLKTKNPLAIIQQSFIPRPLDPQTAITYVDGVEIYFGPLKGQNDQQPIAAANMLVYIENVPQIPITDYTLIASTSIERDNRNIVYLPGSYLKFSGPVPPEKTVTVLHGFD
jgi:peptidoglycan hydrolase-like protein with peptidoglycan-binding domain